MKTGLLGRIVIVHMTQEMCTRAGGTHMPTMDNSHIKVAAAVICFDGEPENDAPHKVNLKLLCNGLDDILVMDVEPGTEPGQYELQEGKVLNVSNGQITAADIVDPKMSKEISEQLEKWNKQALEIYKAFEEATKKFDDEIIPFKKRLGDEWEQIKGRFDMQLTEYKSMVDNTNKINEEIVKKLETLSGQYPETQALIKLYEERSAQFESRMDEVLKMQTTAYKALTEVQEVTKEHMEKGSIGLGATEDNKDSALPTAKEGETGDIKA